MSQIALAGGFSGAATTVITTPAELIKCILQVKSFDSKKSQIRPPTNSIQCAKQIYRDSGLSGFYRGTTATLLRDVPGSAAWFGVYEFVKGMKIENQLITMKAEEPGLFQILVAGGLGGVSHWVVCLPFDNLKTKIQTASTGTYNGLWDCFRKTVKMNGFKTLYSGFIPVLIRAFPANAAAFLGFELTLRIINHIVPLKEKQIS